MVIGIGSWYLAAVKLCLKGRKRGFFTEEKRFLFTNGLSWIVYNKQLIVPGKIFFFLCGMSYKVIRDNESSNEVKINCRWHFILFFLEGGGALPSVEKLVSFYIGSSVASLNIYRKNRKTVPNKRFYRGNHVGNCIIGNI